jgi:hypothetical protein
VNEPARAKGEPSASAASAPASTVGAAFTAFTVTWTVAVSTPPFPSEIVYWKLSPPTNPASGV